MKRASALLLGAILSSGALLAGSCRVGQEPDQIRQVFMLPSEGLVVYEARGGAVLGASMHSGKVRWRYQPDFTLYQHIDYTQKYRLICPVFQLPSGRLILRYHAELHVLEPSTGELSWFKTMPLTAEGRVRCPAVTPDSGVLLFRKSGLVLEKRDVEGHSVWTYDLISMGKAIEPPQVNMKTGDALMLTTTHVISISPRGSLNWAKKREEIQIQQRQRAKNR